MQTQPARRLPLPRARAAASAPQFVFLSTSRVYPVAPLRAARATTETETRFELGAEQPLPGASARGHRRGLPAGRRAHDLRRDQARRRAAGRGVRGSLRAADGRRPLRRDRRAVADGQGRPGRVHATGCSPTTSAAAALHRLRRQRQAGPRPAARRRSARADRRAAGRPGALGGATVNVGGGRGVQPVAARDDGAVREITGTGIVDVRRRPGTRPGDIPIYISDCARLHELTDWRPRHQPREILADIHAWISSASTPSTHARVTGAPIRPDGECNDVVLRTTLSTHVCRQRSSPDPEG